MIMFFARWRVLSNLLLTWFMQINLLVAKILKKKQNHAIKTVFLFFFNKDLPCPILCPVLDIMLGHDTFIIILWRQIL